MNCFQRFSLMCSIVLFLSCKPVAIAILKPLGKEGPISGKVQFVQEKNGKVFMRASINGPGPGMRAMHIHEKANSTAANKSPCIGRHWNPTNRPHGKWGKGPFHKGDIGNIYINAQGKGFYALVTDKWCIGCSDPKKNILGKFIVIHEKEDDYTTQPHGGSGPGKSFGLIRLK